MNGFSVDNCLISLSSIPEVVQFVIQVREMLGRAGFKLRKWVSSGTEVFKAVPSAEL